MRFRSITALALILPSPLCAGDVSAAVAREQRVYAGADAACGAVARLTAATRVEIPARAACAWRREDFCSAQPAAAGLRRSDEYRADPRGVVLAARAGYDSCTAGKTGGARFSSLAAAR